jgi:hypothetical protein
VDMSHRGRMNVVTTARGQRLGEVGARKSYPSMSERHNRRDSCLPADKEYILNDRVIELFKVVNKDH